MDVVRRRVTARGERFDHRDAVVSVVVGDPDLDQRVAEPEHGRSFRCKLHIGAYTSASELMSSETLTPFSYAILVLVGRGGAGAHDLVRMARQGRIYAAAAESQYYAE